MASVTLQVADRFPVGTSVSAYKRSDFPGVLPVPLGAPTGLVAVSSANVAANGSLAFSGLGDGTKYLAYAQVGGRDFYVRFRTPLLDPGSDGLPNAMTDFGAKMDGVTDDTQAWADAIATGLPVVGPAGRVSLIQGGAALKFTADGQRIIGVPGGAQRSNPAQGVGGLWIKRIPTSNGKLFSGGAADAAHRRDGIGFHHIVLHGANGTGPLVETDFCVHGVMEDVWMMFNADSGWVGQEVWDWSCWRSQFEWCSGTVAGTECVVLSNSSTDSTNAVTFYDPRFESFRSGFLNLSGNGFNLHSVKIIGGKAETAVARGDMVKMTGDVRNIRIRDMYLAVDSFDAGYSTPVNVIRANAYADLQITGCRIRQNSAGLIRALAACQLGAGGGHTIRDNLFDNSAGDPTVGILSIDGGSSDFDHSNNRYQVATTKPRVAGLNGSELLP